MELLLIFFLPKRCCGGGCSAARSCPTLCGPMDCNMPGSSVLLISWSLLKFAVIESMMPSNLCYPLLLLQYFSASGSFPMHWLITLGGASASASDLPMTIQSLFPVGLTRLISLLSKGLLRVFSSTTVQKHQFFSGSTFFMVQLSHLYMTTGKTIALTIQTFVGKVMSLLFNTLPRFVKAFLPRSKCLLISWQ